MTTSKPVSRGPVAFWWEVGMLTRPEWIPFAEDLAWRAQKWERSLVDEASTGVDIVAPEAGSGFRNSIQATVQQILAEALESFQVPEPCAVPTPSVQTREWLQNQYIDLIKSIPEVVEVRLWNDDEGPALMTVISATPFDDEPRYRVFDAQIEVMEQMEEPLLGFRMVNLQEMAECGLGAQGPLTGQVVWSR